MDLDTLKNNRDIIGEYGDLYMRLNGYYWNGPSGTKEPEFGYRLFEGNTSINLEAAAAILALSVSK